MSNRALKEIIPNRVAVPSGLKFFDGIACVFQRRTKEDEASCRLNFELNFRDFNVS